MVFGKWKGSKRKPLLGAPGVSVKSLQKFVLSNREEKLVC